MEDGRFIELGKPKVEVMPSARQSAESERRLIFSASQVGGQSANKKRKMSTEISSIDRVKLFFDIHVLHINFMFFGT